MGVPASAGGVCVGCATVRGVLGVPASADECGLLGASALAGEGRLPASDGEGRQLGASASAGAGRLPGPAGEGMLPGVPASAIGVLPDTCGCGERRSPGGRGGGCSRVVLGGRGGGCSSVLGDCGWSNMLGDCGCSKPVLPPSSSVGIDGSGSGSGSGNNLRMRAGAQECEVKGGQGCAGCERACPTFSLVLMPPPP